MAKNKRSAYKLTPPPPPAKTNIFAKIFRFFFPKNWREELDRGRMVGVQVAKSKKVIKRK